MGRVPSWMPSTNGWSIKSDQRLVGNDDLTASMNF
jgi:hypothetical protein